MNGDNIFEFVNDAFAGLCGVPKTDIVRNPFRKVFSKLGVDDADLNRFEKMMVDKKKTSFECLLNTRGDRIFKCISDPVYRDFNAEWSVVTFFPIESLNNPGLFDPKDLYSEVTSLRLAIESFRTLQKSTWGNHQSLCSSAATQLARFFNTPVAGVLLIKNSIVEFGVRYQNGRLIDERGVRIQDHPARIFLAKTPSISIHYGKTIEIPSTSGESPLRLNSLFGIPLINSSNEVTGVIFVASLEERYFNNIEMDILEIIAWYIMSAFGSSESMDGESAFEKHPDKLAFFNAFFTGLAHEVRNPLNGIIALNESLRKDMAGNEDYRKVIDLIEEQAVRLSSLTQQLVILGEPIKAQPMLFSTFLELCNYTVEEWRIKQPDNVRVQVLEPQNNHHSACKVDPKCFPHVLHLLLDNAKFHCSDGEILVDVGEIGNEVYIKIIDQGCGISAEARKRIFDPFFTTHKKKNGLGLCIVKSVIERHGGTVSIENNRYTSGCTAEIRLPQTNYGSMSF